MRKTVIISGAINAGKSSVSRELAQKMGNCAHIEVDSLRRFLFFMPLKQSLPLNLANAICVAQNLLASEIDVIIDYPLSSSEFRQIERQLSPVSAVHAFVLSPTLDVVLSNRGSRELSEGERRRIPEMYAEGLHDPGFGHVIDNGDLSLVQTVALIYDILQGATGFAS